jgi:phenylpyruvate tautomerase PptA (4-oxalocrotonate tautomerase family)
MSRQNKAAKKKIIAAGITKVHLAGDSGAKSTVAKHGKEKHKRWFMAGITEAGKTGLKKGKSSK